MKIRKIRSRVVERGQLTIPKKLRDRLGISTGTVLELHEQDGKLVIEKVEPPGDPVDAVYGCLGQGRSSDAVVAVLRGDG